MDTKEWTEMAALADAGGAPELTEKDLKRSLASEAKAMNNMEGKDEKGDVRVETMASAMDAFQGMQRKLQEESRTYESLAQGASTKTRRARRDYDFD